MLRGFTFATAGVGVGIPAGQLGDSHVDLLRISLIAARALHRVHRRASERNQDCLAKQLRSFFLGVEHEETSPADGVGVVAGRLAGEDG